MLELIWNREEMNMDSYSLSPRVKDNYLVKVQRVNMQMRKDSTCDFYLHNIDCGERESSTLPVSFLVGWVFYPAWAT